MDNKRIIYSTRENIKSTLVIFLKYKKSVLWVNFFVALLTLLTQFAATYLPGWIVDLLTGENAGTQIWTRELPVIALIGISELVIEVLNRKKALAYQAVSQKTALDINRVQVGARYRLTEEKEFQDLAYESVRCTQTWGGKRVLTAVVDDLFYLFQAIGGFLLFAVLLSTVNPVIAVFLMIAPAVISYQKASGLLVFSGIVIFCFYSFILLKERLPVEKFGYDAVFFILLILCFAWGGDTCAYFAGRAFGKHKLCPVVSPKKTVEGAIGGVLGTMVFGVVATLIYSIAANRMEAFTRSNIGVSMYVIIALLGCIAAARA